MRNNNLFFALKKKPLISFAVTATIATSMYAYYQYTSCYRDYPKDLYTVLNYYGFNLPEQKQALRYLMQKSGIKNTDELLNYQATSATELSRLILELVKVTQDKFTIRKGEQERWEVETSDWMKDKEQEEEILTALKTLKMIDAIPTTVNNSEVICILGASKIIMLLRLQYAEELLMNNKLAAKWLVLLAGERYVTPDKDDKKIDGSKQELQQLASKLGKEISKLTETNLMREAYENSKLYGQFSDHFLLIDTPKRDLPRPTTETTVAEFCEWLKKQPEIKMITFVSNQPHVEYQKSIITRVFEKHGIHLNFEVIGPQYDIKADNNREKQINYTIQALGSRIWAATPGVIDAIGLDISDPKLQEDYLEIYKNQPLIYQHLETKFPKAKSKGP